MLTLPVKAKQGGTCTLRFYYHMFGKHVKDLNVYTLTSGKLDTVFSVSGNFGYEWKFAKVDLSKNVDKFQIVFEGKKLFYLCFFFCLVIENTIKTVSLYNKKKRTSYRNLEKILQKEF